MARPGLLRHRKFARLARMVGSKPLALGHLEMLWEVAYENGDALLGDAHDVEFLAEWAGPAGELAAALVSAGFLDDDGGKLSVHDLWHHAPDYVRKRLKREEERRKEGDELRTMAAERRTVTGQSPPNGRTPAPAPAPAPAQTATAPASVARLPGKAEVLATQYPATQAVIDALATKGIVMAHAAQPERRSAIEAACAAVDPAAAAEAVEASFETCRKAWIGWHLEAIVAARRAGPATQEVEPDLRWMDALNDLDRRKAEGAWRVAKDDITATFKAEARSRALVSAAEMLRMEFAS